MSDEVTILRRKLEVVRGLLFNLFSSLQHGVLFGSGAHELESDNKHTSYLQSHFVSVHVHFPV